MIHNFVVGKMEEKEKGRGWGGGWVLGAGAPIILIHCQCHDIVHNIIINDVVAMTMTLCP